MFILYVWIETIECHLQKDIYSYNLNLRDYSTSVL